MSLLLLFHYQLLLLTYSGYNTRFGLQYVNYTSFERSYKASFFEYVNAFKVYAEDPVVPIFVPGK